MTYYISDLHFGHANILSFDNRPFVSIQAHDETLIENWNRVVGPDDEVWILGDFSWHNATTTITILKQLNGIKKLVIGNHDHKLLKNANVRALFAEITNYKEIELDNGAGIVLCHYPIPTYNHHYFGWVHLYGHVHNSWEAHMIEHFQREMTDLYCQPSAMYNVGCMMPYMNYTPKTLQEIILCYDSMEKENECLGDKKETTK